MRIEESIQQYKRTDIHNRGTRAVFAALLGALMIVAVLPTAAGATGAYIWADKIDGQFVVQGRYFPSSTTGKVSASIGHSTCDKPVHTFKNGYFWLTCHALDNVAGTAKVKATVGKVSASTSKRFTAVAQGSSVSKPSAAPKATGAPAASNNSSQITEQQAANGDIPVAASGQPAAAPKPQAAAPKPAASAPAAQPAAKPTVAASSFSTGASGWNLAWSDDFNTLDKGTWGVYDGAGNGGVGTRSPSAVSANNGELQITAHGNTAGGVASHTKLTYGRVEIRARLDSGSGYNTAMLLWPSSENWPTDGEIDISEIFSGHYDENGNFVHWGSDNSQSGKFTALDTSQWHTYAVDWEPGSVTWYVDGQQTMKSTNGSASPDTAHFIALQLDVSHKNTARTDGLTYHVDWVKVYKH